MRTKSIIIFTIHRRIQLTQLIHIANNYVQLIPKRVSNANWAKRSAAKITVTLFSRYKFFSRIFIGRMRRARMRLHTSNVTCKLVCVALS